jgi:peptide/nickel transport system permease protein
MSAQGAVPTLVRAAPGQTRGPFIRLGDRQRRALHRFRQSPLSMLGLAIILLLLVVAIVGPVVVPYPEDASGALNIKEKLDPPTWAHPFGTDQVGRDIFTRIIVGARVSLVAGMVVIALAFTVGTLLGAVAGFFGGRLSEGIMRTTDIFLTIPDLILAMAFAAALGPGLFNVMIAVSLVWWPGYCRLARANVVALRDSQFAEAAQSIGASRARVLFTHILPNAFPTILVKASMDIGFAVLTTAALGFIGLGTQPPTPDWGVMIADGRKYLREAWWFSTFPGIAILLTVLAFNLLGDGLRDVLDPRSRRQA